MLIALVTNYVLIIFSTSYSLNNISLSFESLLISDNIKLTLLYSDFFQIAYVSTGSGSVREMYVQV